MARQQLVKAQDDLIAAEEELAAAKAAHKAAVARWRGAVAERRRVLLEHVGDEPTPTAMRTAAEALGLTLPRVYQMLREALGKMASEA